MAKLDDKGREILDSTPKAVPAGFHRPPTLREQMIALIRSEAFAQARLQAGEETFEEADDFEVGDDYDPRSPYEQHFDQDQNIDNLRQSLKPKSNPKFENETPKKPAPSDKGAGSQADLSAEDQD